MNLLDAIGAQVPGTEFILEPVAEDAALARLEAAQADMIVPYAPTPLEGKPFFLSRMPVTKAYYVLYTNAARPLDFENLAKYTIEGNRRNEAVLGMPLRQSGGPVESLTKLHDGVIDGYINAEGATDPALRLLGFTDIRRRLYREADNYVLLPKTDTGRRIDELLSIAVPLAAGTPGYDAMQKRPYGDWQP